MLVDASALEQVLTEAGQPGWPTRRRSIVGRRCGRCAVEGLLIPREFTPGLEHDPRRHGVGGTGVGPTVSDRP